MAQTTSQILQQRGIEVVHYTLPVTYECARGFALQHVLSDEEIIVHIGLADKRQHVSLEQRAHNRHGATLDNASRTPAESLNGKLLLSGPSVLRSKLDLEKLKVSLSRYPWQDKVDAHFTTPKIRITQDAGQYVCNAIYYHSLMSHPRTVFIHIPYLDERESDIFAQALAGAIAKEWLVRAELYTEDAQTE